MNGDAGYRECLAHLFEPLFHVFHECAPDGLPVCSPIMFSADEGWGDPWPYPVAVNRCQDGRWLSAVAKDLVRLRYYCVGATRPCTV